MDDVHENAAKPRWSPLGTLLMWHVIMSALVVIGTLVLLADASLGANRWPAAGLLAVLALVYAWLARSGRVDRPWAAGIYLSVLIGVLCGLTLLDVSVFFMLYIAYPQIWFFGSGTIRWGVAWSVVLSLAFGLSLMAAAGFSGSTLGQFVWTALIGTGISIAVGTWFTLVVRESLSRGELIEQLESTRAQLAEANHAAGVVAERQRMATEIHDTLAQGFTSIITQAQIGSALVGRDPRAAAGRFALIEATARENLAEARALVAAGAPVDLSEDLAAALNRLAVRFTEETGVRVDVTVDGEQRLSRDAEVVLLRCCQEALANVRRHAAAGRVSIRLAMNGDGTAGIEIADDGKGFDPAAAKGFGLNGIRGRVESAGGSLELRSAVGDGTTLRVSVPADRQEGGR